MALSRVDITIKLDDDGSMSWALGEPYQLPEGEGELGIEHLGDHSLHGVRTIRVTAHSAGFAHIVARELVHKEKELRRKVVHDLAQRALESVARSEMGGYSLRGGVLDEATVV